MVMGLKPKPVIKRKSYEAIHDIQGKGENEWGKAEQQWLTAKFFSMTQGQAHPNRSQPKAISVTQANVISQVNSFKLSQHEEELIHHLQVSRIKKK